MQGEGVDVGAVGGAWLGAVVEDPDDLLVVLVLALMAEKWRRMENIQRPWKAG